MKSAVLRWTILGTFVAVLAASVYLLWTNDTASRSVSNAANIFDRRAEPLIGRVLDMRMAQQAYVAAGQGYEFWGSKVTAQIAGLRDDLTNLRGLALTPQAQTHLDEALSSLGDFERMDARAREYSRSNQRLLASDLIFSDGLEKTAAILDSVQSSRSAETERHDAISKAARERELKIAGAAATAVVVLALLLVPMPRLEPNSDFVTATADARATAAETAASTFEAEPLMLRDARDPVPPLPTVTPPSLREAETQALDPFDLGRVASLCTELARVVDTRSLPAVLERTASVLDANGVVLWVADPDGRELNPIVTHGYPMQLVTRLGTIPRDAQNATAAAFRTALLQTVHADSISNGAIAVPLVTPTGCVGVMAAEVRHGGEKQDAKLAAAAIVAAQLATLVGPPSARAQGRPETANAS